MTQLQRAAWWQPTWKKLIALSTGLFFTFTVFLASRIQLGLDPALQRQKKALVRSVPSLAVKPTADQEDSLDGWEQEDDEEAEASTQTVAPDTSTAAPVDPNPPVTHSS